MEQRLTWLVIGAGAIGTYIGGSLILHGQKVVFLERPEFISEIQQHGLKLNIHGQEHRILHPYIYSALPNALAQTSFDIAILALKSFDTQSTLDLIRPCSSEFPSLLCLQNGVENEALLKTVLGIEKVIAGTVTSSIRRRAAGDVILERARGIGIEDGHPISSKIASVLSDAGFNVHLYPSAPAMKWSKMLTNLMVNASSAILDMKPAEILADPALYAIEVCQLREAITVSHAHHIRIIDLPGTPVRLFAWMVDNLPPSLSRFLLMYMLGKGRGHKMPSFHIDLHSGRRKSEVDYLNGAVVRFGDLVNIPTPVNRWLNRILLELTKGNLPLDEFAHRPDKYLEEIRIIKRSQSGK